VAACIRSTIPVFSHDVTYIAVMLQCYTSVQIVLVF
jgi:hypothetical protein